MKSFRSVYCVAAVLALAPIGVRALTWQKSRPQQIDPSVAKSGETLFMHQWTPRDPLANGGDGLGPVFNATSCVACHNQGGVGGGGDLQHNVTTFTVRADTPGENPRQGVVHAFAVSYQESLAQVDPSLPPVVRPSLQQVVSLAGREKHCLPFPRGVSISQRNTPALFGAKLIDELPERDIIAGERRQWLKAGMAPTEAENVPVGRALRLTDRRVGRFGWKAQTASLADFVQAACANELGLGNPGQAQPRPLGRPDYQAPGLDLTADQCDQLTTFVSSLARPMERLPQSASAAEDAGAGKKLFAKTGCAECHTPKLGAVDGIYSDLLLHRMGPDLVGGGAYNEPPPETPAFKPGEAPRADEWRTPPLWGVADSAPYMHDGRAATLEEAIRLHGGQGAGAAQRFAKLTPSEKTQMIAFLNTLRAPEESPVAPARPAKP
jgi:CxxC motif-containing protein (DUF1111 family)